MQNITIKDVANSAGVSTATVSRVLSGTGYFDKDTARLVHEAVENLGYRRNVNWKRLSQNSSETLCFLLGNRDSLNSMQVKMLMASEKTAAAEDFDLFFASFRYAAETPFRRLELPRLLAQAGAVDGVILAGLHYENLLNALDDLKIPHVILGNTYIGANEKLEYDALVYDDVTGLYEATKYLLRLGHRRIAFVGNVALPWFARRYQGYCRAMAEAGLERIEYTEKWAVKLPEYGNLAAADLLRRMPRPTAIIAANDELAGGVWKTLINRGIAVPHELSLMGFGDREEFRLLEPALTTVSAMEEEVGTELTAMLLLKLKDPQKKTPARVFPCQIVERSSCAAPAAELS